MQQKTHRKVSEWIKLKSNKILTFIYTYNFEGQIKRVFVIDFFQIVHAVLH